MLAVTTPIPVDRDLWRSYMDRHRHNHLHQYHNGGIWPFIGGFWVAGHAGQKRPGAAGAGQARPRQPPTANRQDDRRSTKWLHGQTLKPMGMAGQSWSAAAFLIAKQALETGKFAI